MKSRELLVQYNFECLLISEKKDLNDNYVSQHVNDLFSKLTNLCISLSFLKKDELDKSINWLLNYIDKDSLNFNNNIEKTQKKDPLIMIRDLFFDDLKWYVSGLSYENGKVSMNISLLIKDNKEKEKELSRNYFERFISLVEFHLQKKISDEIKITPLLVEINAELTQKDSRVINFRNSRFSNENNI